MATAEALKPAIAKYQEVQTQFESVVDSQQQLVSQLSENQQVQKEFNSLGSDARIYKRTGPVLLPQDFTEAKDNVNKRIEFIQKELERVEQQIHTLSSKRDTIKSEIIALQQRPQP